MNRRGFLTRLWIGFGVLAGAEIAWAVLAFLRPRRTELDQTGAESIIEAGPAKTFEPGTVTAFPRGPFYLARLEDGGFLALSCKCTHLGCTVPWVQAQDKFICPCHSSSFDITGGVMTAPASRPLDLYQIVIENDVVKVDMRKCIRRTEFRKDQVVYPREI